MVIEIKNRSQRIIVCGSRTFSDLGRAREVLSFWLTDPDDTIVVHGDARGADRTAALVAKRLGYELEAYPANWNDEGRSAGYKRNERMAKLPGVTMCIAFWDGESRGTKHMIDIAKKHEIPVVIDQVGREATDTYHYREEIRDGEFIDEYGERRDF